MTKMFRSTAVYTSTAPIELVSVENNAFKPGEFLEFVIKYEFIPGGYATLKISSGPEMNGRPTYAIESTAKSNKFVSAFFKVRDYNASLVDAESLATLSFHQNLREGRYKVVRNTKMNYSSNTYTYERQYKGRTTYKEGVVGIAVSDILSSFYYSRTLPLELGESYFIEVFTDKRVYPLRVDVDDKLQKIKVAAGKFECVRIRPFIIGDAIFRPKKKSGKLLIWLTNDERKMPVLIRSEVFIGAFDAELKNYSFR